MKDKPIKIAYLTGLSFLSDTCDDPYSKLAWSGTLYYMRKALEHEFDEVVVLTPDKLIVRRIIFWYLKFIKKICSKLFKKRYEGYFSQLLAWYYSISYSKQLKNSNFDLIVIPHPTVPAKIKTQIPIFHIYDSTFKNVDNYYDCFFNLINFCSIESNHTSYNTIHNSDVLIYSSDWAAKSAIEDYGADKKKVHVIPFGANIDKAPDMDKIRSRDLSGTCNLLFFGQWWERKGGNIALDTIKELLIKNIDAKLFIVGRKDDNIKYKCVEQIKFLDKNNPNDYKKYEDLLYDAHILLFPTRADATPIAFCEAGAYSLPSIASRTGGVTSLIKNGVNGYTLPYEATGKEYAKVIGELWGDKEKYRELSANARKRFEDELNWEHWGKEFKKVYLEHIKRKG